ncbi:MAG: hypothetical protein ACR2H3_01995 [Acidimicrobiales bacterium]
MSMFGLRGRPSPARLAGDLARSALAANIACGPLCVFGVGGSGVGWYCVLVQRRLFVAADGSHVVQCQFI